MKRICCLLLTFILCLPLTSSLVLTHAADSAINSPEKGQQLVVHYDFEGSTESERLQDKANDGKSADHLIASDQKTVSGLNGTTYTNTAKQMLCRYTGEDQAITQDSSLIQSTDIGAIIGEHTWVLRFQMKDSNATKDDYVEIIDCRDFTSGKNNRAFVLMYDRANRCFCVSIAKSTGAASTQVNFSLPDAAYTDAQKTSLDGTLWWNLAVSVERTDDDTWMCDLYYAIEGNGKNQNWSQGTSGTLYKGERKALTDANYLRLPYSESNGTVVLDDVKLYAAPRSLGDLKLYNTPPAFQTDSAVLGLGYQVATVDGEYRIRFVAEVNGLNHNGVGMEVSAYTGSTDKYWESVKTDTVYTSLLSVDSEDGGIKKVSAKQGCYLFSLTVQNVPKTQTVLFSVTPYTVETDGEKHYGKTFDVLFYKPSGSTEYTHKAIWRDVSSVIYADQYEAAFPVSIDNSSHAMAEYTGNDSSNSVIRLDQCLVSALRERMGTSTAVFAIEKTTVLYNGYIQKLNTKDYTATAKQDGARILIPAQFAEQYFGKTLEKDALGFVDLTAVSADEGYILERYGELVILMPSNAVNFAVAGKTYKGFSNREYLARCEAFLNSPYYPEPTTDAESTRVVIAAASPAFQTEPNTSWTSQTYQTLYSPSIAVDVQNGETILYASWERCNYKFGKESSPVTVVAESRDGGVTWSELAEVSGVKQASLYVLDHTVYVFGCNESGSNNWYGIVARLNHDTMEFDTVRIEVNASSAPGAVVVHNGRIYRAYSGYVISASVNDDLMQAKSWTVSSPRVTTGEPVLTVGPDGEVYMLIRMADSNNPNGYVKIYKVASDGVSLNEVESINGVACANSKVYLGTGYSFFNIRRDVNGTYYSLISKHTVKDAPGTQRTVLVLVSSDDLVNWTEVTSVIVEREMLNEVYAAFVHGWQYVDFGFDGEDIVLIVREATGETNWFHDGKYITFYRISNYKSLSVNG